MTIGAAARRVYRTISTTAPPQTSSDPTAWRRLPSHHRRRRRLLMCSRIPHRPSSRQRGRKGGSAC
eukprot:4069430-Prymnesium_polylepis.1